MPPRTSHQPEEPTGRYYEESRDGGDEQAQEAASFRDQNTSTVSSEIDQCSNLYSDDLALHPTVVYQGGLMGSDEKLGVPISKDGMDTSDSDDMMMLTFSGEASVSSLEDSYVEGDSWSTIDDEDSEGSNTLMLLRDIYSQDEADGLFIFTDEEVSPSNVPQEPSDLEKSTHSEGSGRKITTKMINQLLIGRQKSQTRIGEHPSPDLLHRDSFSFGENDEYSNSLGGMDQDTSSGSSSAYSDQWIPRKYMIWSRLNSLRSIGLSGSDETCSCDTPGFISKAVRSMRRQRRRRHSVPATSLLDSVDTSSSTVDLDNFHIDTVSAWEEDIILNDSDRLSAKKSLQANDTFHGFSSSVASLRTLLKKKGGAVFRNNSRKRNQTYPSHASSTGSTVDSTSNYLDQDTNSFKTIEEGNPDRSLQKCSGVANIAKSLLEEHYEGHLFSESSASADEVGGVMNGPRQINRPSSLIPSIRDELFVGKLGNSKKKESLQVKPRTLVETLEIHAQCPISSAQEVERKESPSLPKGSQGCEPIIKGNCGKDVRHRLTDGNESMMSKESGTHPSSSDLEANAHVIGWKRIKRKSKSKKKSSGGQSRLKRKSGNEERPRSSRIQLNAVSLQSGTAPWSPRLIRSVTPISTTALDARLTSRSIAVSLGLGQEADELLTILNESIERQTRRIDAKEIPQMTCIRLTRDLYIPNFGLYVLQSIRYFKQTVFV